VTRGGALLAPLAVALLAALPAAASSRPYVRGVAVGLFSHDPDHPYAEKLREIRALGATHVLYLTHWWQDHSRATEIGPDPEKTLPDERLRALVALARAAGLKVFLMPILGLKRKRPMEWRGVIQPRDPAAWRRSYSRFLLHHARLAAEAGVDLLAVGSELSSFDGDRAFWRRLVGRVRRVFSGALTYSANWDRYESVRFWDLLDYVGISAYFEVGRSLERLTEEAVAERWEEVRSRLAAFHRHLRRPVPLLFTEIGYPSRRGGCTFPWNGSLGTPVDVEEQHLCYRAAARAWIGAPFLGGVFFWIWWDDGGPRDGGYTPRGKPALEVVRRWFREAGR
jgi:hypothetical protein